MYLADVTVGVISISSCYKLAERKSPRMDGRNAIFIFTSGFAYEPAG
jgi:hypothetical protein